MISLSWWREAPTELVLAWRRGTLSFVQRDDPNVFCVPFRAHEAQSTNVSGPVEIMQV